MLVHCNHFFPKWLSIVKDEKRGTLNFLFTVLKLREKIELFGILKALKTEEDPEQWSEVCRQFAWHKY
jgi:hypothetical protein